jgi:hypothetical protein
VEASVTATADHCFAISHYSEFDRILSVHRIRARLVAGSVADRRLAKVSSRPAAKSYSHASNDERRRDAMTMMPVGRDVTL